MAATAAACRDEATEDSAAAAVAPVLFALFAAFMADADADAALLVASIAAFFNRAATSCRFNLSSEKEGEEEDELLQTARSLRAIGRSREALLAAPLSGEESSAAATTARPRRAPKVLGLGAGTEIIVVVVVAIVTLLAPVLWRRRRLLLLLLTRACR